MNYQLFVTVGTSIFSNLLDWAGQTDHQHVDRLRSAWESCRNRRGSEEQKELLNTIAKTSFMQCYEKVVPNKKRRGSRQSFWEKKEISGINLFQNEQASAEIQSTLKLLNDNSWKDKHFDLHLIATDTTLSVMAAGLVRDFFSDHPGIKGQIHLKSISKLQVEDPEGFSDTGLQELVDYIIQSLRPDNPKSSKLKKGILNVTGGYKGVVPVLSIAGQLLELPIVYQYQESEALLHMHPLPFNFDWTFMEIYRYYLIQTKRKNIAGPGEPAEWRKIVPAAVLKTDQERRFFEKQLVEMQLMKKLPKSRGYLVTYLGELLQLNMDEVFPLSSYVYGSAVEFLFFECMLADPFEWRSTQYCYVEHSVKFAVGSGEKQEYREIDLLLYPDRTDRSSIIMVEIKSFTQLLPKRKGETYNYQEQFRKQLAGIADGKIPKPDLFILMLYGYKPINSWDYLNGSFDLMWSDIQEAGIAGLEVWIVDLPVSEPDHSNNRNLYASLLKKKLTRNKAKVKAANAGNSFGPEYLHLRQHVSYPSEQQKN